MDDSYKKLLKVLVLVVVLMAIPAFVYLYWRSGTLDFRRGFDFESDDWDSCFKIGKKPRESLEGNLYFVHSPASRKNWSLMCFDFNEWELRKVIDLPPEFDNTDPHLSTESASNYLIFSPMGHEGYTQTFFRFDLESYRFRKTTFPDIYQIIQVGELNDEEIIVIRRDLMKYDGNLYRIKRNSGDDANHKIEEIYYNNHNIFDGGGISFDDVDGPALYFTGSYINDDGTTITRIFRLNDVDSSPVPVSFFPPGKLIGRNNLFPYPVRNDWKYFIGYTDMWVGTVTEWTSRQPGLCLVMVDMFDKKETFENRRWLVRLPSRNPQSMPLLVFPDGKYVLVEQFCEDPLRMEGIIVVNMITGKQIPVLAHKEHFVGAVMDFAWE